MADPKQKVQFKILSKTPALAMDGHLITTKTDGTGEIVFFQILNQNGDLVEVNGISTIRMTVAQLKALSNAILTTIEQHDKSASSKK
ncbi:MAG: hypothetical protein WC894_02670 [Patescibacteria group bacterium]